MGRAGGGDVDLHAHVLLTVVLLLFLENCDAPH